jgi:hypothetical protein
MRQRRSVRNRCDPIQKNERRLYGEPKFVNHQSMEIFTACLFSIVIDFFAFALVGFVLAFFVKDWQLTFGRSGAIRFASVAAAGTAILAKPKPTAARLFRRSQSGFQWFCAVAAALNRS